MPIKLQWMKGRNLGLGLIFLGVMTLLQVIFILIAQFGFSIGSIYVVALVPFGVILATFYSTLVLFESRTEMSQYRSKIQKRPQKFKKKKKDTNKVKAIINKINWVYAKPALIIAGGFFGGFWITYLILFALVEDQTIVFLIAENLGAIFSLLIATYNETSTYRKTR